MASLRGMDIGFRVFIFFVSTAEKFTSASSVAEVVLSSCGGGAGAGAGAGGGGGGGGEPETLKARNK